MLYLYRYLITAAPVSHLKLLTVAQIDDKYSLMRRDIVLLHKSHEWFIFVGLDEYLIPEKLGE